MSLTQLTPLPQGAKQQPQTQSPRNNVWRIVSLTAEACGNLQEELVVKNEKIRRLQAKLSKLQGLIEERRGRV
jgi:hypothetical protein